MGKSILKRLGALALCAALTGGTALAANTVYRTITVQYSGIKLVVDGVEVTPKDANGTTVEPFIYNGTTYLPVRAVGSAIGKQVTWDGGSQTVYLGEAPGQKNYRQYRIIGRGAICENILRPDAARFYSNT